MTDLSLKERAFKDIEKLEKALEEFKQDTELKTRYAHVLEWATNYFNDSRHFYDQKDYFTSFGAANYAYGMLDAILIAEGKKKDEC